MNIHEMEKQARKNSEYRQTEYNLQWDTPFMSSRVLIGLMLKSGLSRSQIIRKAKLTQPSFSRAEGYGCSLTYLNKIAKVCGKKLEIKVVDVKKLK